MKKNQTQTQTPKNKKIKIEKDQTEGKKKKKKDGMAASQRWKRWQLAGVAVRVLLFVLKVDIEAARSSILTTPASAIHRGKFTLPRCVVHSR